MTTLVTGGAGFVGSAVVRALLARGEDVAVMLRANSDRRLLEDLDIKLVIGDLDEPASLKAAVVGCTSLYHVAADYRLWVRRPADIYRTNVEGSRSLMRAAAEAGVARMVYTSSVATLGLTGTAEPADETTPTDLDHMIGHYKRSKFLAERAVKDLVDQEGLPAVIVNPSAPVGPRDAKPTPTGRLVLDAARAKMPAFVETGLNIVHVDDVAAGHLQAFDRGRIGERYILGGDDMMLGDILKAVAEMAGVRAPTLKLPIGPLMPIAHLVEACWRLTGRSNDPFVTVDGLRMARKLMFFSSAKAVADLGYKPRPALAAFDDAIGWYRRCGYL